MNTKIITACSFMLSLGLMTISSNSHATSYYKWVDAKGTTHYTKTPPPRGAKQTKTVDTWGWHNSAPTPARVSEEPKQADPAPVQNQPNQAAPQNSPQPVESQPQTSQESAAPPV